jgi:hypothetical protein
MRRDEVRAGSGDAGPHPPSRAGYVAKKYVDRVAILDAALNRAGLEDFVVADDGSRPINDVAEEILQRAGWL